MNYPLDILTFSSASTLMRCPKLYHWRYERRIRPRRADMGGSLRIGSAFHAGREAYENGGIDAGLVAVGEWEDAQNAIGDGVRRVEQEAAKARSMLIASSRVWPRTHGDLVEHVMEMPLVNPATGRCSRTFRYSGKTDKVEGPPDRAVLVDWKGVSDAQQFIRYLRRSFQIELYAAALLNEGIRVVAAKYRLVTFPSIKLSKIDGFGVLSEDAAVSNYAERCLDWLMVDGGTTRLVEWDHPINQGRIEMARAWLWDVGQDVLQRRTSGRWPKNGMACRDYNRVCEFDSLCNIEDMGGDPADLIAERFEDSEPHPELVQVI